MLYYTFSKIVLLDEQKCYPRVKLKYKDSMSFDDRCYFIFRNLILKIILFIYEK